MAARRSVVHVLGLAVLFLVHAPCALAAEPPKLNGADTAWMIVASALVLFMTLPGLALFYAGLVRAKNVLSVLMQCFAITCVVTLAWVICGYSVAFGEGNAWWGGWFGFNAGSALAADGTAAMAMLVTHIAAATASLVWMFCEWVRFGKPSALGIVTGMVAGLGTITPASGFVGPIGAIAIGLAAGLLCFFATNYMKRALGVDDSLDVFPVHGVGGILGTTLTGVFAATAFGGVGYPEGQSMAGQVGVQLAGVAATGVWSGVLTWVLLKVTDAVVGLRVAHEEET